MTNENEKSFEGHLMKDPSLRKMTTFKYSPFIHQY